MNQWAKSGTCRISIFIIIQDEFSLLKTDDLYVSYVNKINVLERERKRERKRERERERERERDLYVSC